MCSSRKKSPPPPFSKMLAEISKGRVVSKTKALKETTCTKPKWIHICWTFFFRIFRTLQVEDGQVMIHKCTVHQCVQCLFSQCVQCVQCLFSQCTTVATLLCTCNAVVYTLYSLVTQVIIFYYYYYYYIYFYVGRLYLVKSKYNFVGNIHKEHHANSWYCNISSRNKMHNHQ